MVWLPYSYSTRAPSTHALKVTSVLSQNKLSVCQCIWMIYAIGGTKLTVLLSFWASQDRLWGLSCGWQLEEISVMAPESQLLLSPSFLWWMKPNSSSAEMGSVYLLWSLFPSSVITSMCHNGIWNEVIWDQSMAVSGSYFQRGCSFLLRVSDLRNNGESK